MDKGSSPDVISVSPISDEVSSAIPVWRRALAWAGGAFLGAVLLLAAWAKALDPSGFAGQISSEGLDFLLPATAIAFVALALEVFLGSALILGLRRRWLLVVTSLLVLFFVFLTGRAYQRHLQGIEPLEGSSCGCFGNLVERTPAEAFWQDLALMLPALLLAWWVVGGTRRGSGALWMVVTGLALGIVVLAWKAPELPLDNLATRLSPGVEVESFCAGSQDDGSRICLDAILPELVEGRHVVILADLADETFGEEVSRLNEYHWSGEEPRLWVLSANTEEELFAFRLGRGPAFSIREVPGPLLDPLYRTLPRSFVAVDGVVTETWTGLPPLEEFGGKPSA